MLSLLMVLLTLALSDAQSADVRPPLQPFAFLVGSCWTGSFPGGKATDTHQDVTQRVRSDIEYLANWSLMGDVFILLRTVQVLVHDKAY